MNRETEKLSAPVRVRKIPQVIAATVQKRIESYDALFDIMPQMGDEMELLGCKCAEPEYCFTHYLEPRYKEEEILIEVCEAVTEKKQDSKMIKFQVFPEVEAACIFHKGSYDKCPKTYEIILKYIEDKE